MPEVSQEMKSLKAQVDSLQKAIDRITNDPYLIAHQVFGSLTFFKTHYASGADYDNHLQQIIRILRERGKGELHLQTAKFLTGLADLLDKTT